MSGSYYTLDAKYNTLLALIQQNASLNTTDNIKDVLTAGDNAAGLNITNLNNLDCITINGAVYPPPSGGSYWIENTSGNVSGADITAPAGAYSILNATTLPVDLYIGGVLSTSLDVNSSTSLTSLTSPLLEIVAPFSFTPQDSGTTTAVFNAIINAATPYSQKIFIAVGGAGILLTSYNGLTWASRNSQFGANAINGIGSGFNFNTFQREIVAVGQNGTLSTSSNGTSWTSRSSQFGATSINDVGFGDFSGGGGGGGGGIWVAVGAAGTISTSTNLSTWTLRTSGFGAFAINAISFGSVGGSLLFVIGGADGRLSTSTDGINWAPRSAQFSQETITSIGYGLIGGVGAFIAVGSFSKLSTSTDGINWTARTPNFNNQVIRDIGYGNVGLDGGVPTWVATGDAAQIKTSPDGVVWTSRKSGFPSPMNPSVSGVAYGNVGMSNTPSYIIVGIQLGLISTSNPFPAPIKAQLTPITYQSIP